MLYLPIYYLYRLAVCTCIGARSTGQAVKCIIGVLMAHLTACLSALGQGGAVRYAEHVAHGIVGVGVVHDVRTLDADCEVLQPATLWVVAVEGLCAVAVLQVGALLELVVAYLVHVRSRRKSFTMVLYLNIQMT